MVLEKDTNYTYSDPMAFTAVSRAQNRAITKGTDPEAATCRAKLQRARSALSRQMDRELRLRDGAENLLRATSTAGAKDGSVIDRSSKNKKLRNTVALELSFLRANVRLLADELADLNGSVDVYQHCDGDDSHSEGSVDRDNRHCCSCRRVATNIADRSVIRNRRRQNLQQQMPMIAVPLKDTRPIDFRPPLERFICQFYGIDLSADEIDDTDYRDDVENNQCNQQQRRLLPLREAANELTQLRLDTQTPSRDADGVRLLLRYYRQLYYVDRRFFPPLTSPTVSVAVTHTTIQSRHNHQHKQQQHDDMPSPAIYFQWYDSFGSVVPSCGQRTIRFEQACVLFNVAAVLTQMGTKLDRRLWRNSDYSRDDQEDDSDATHCFLRAAGAYRHIGDTFANAPTRAADLHATNQLYILMMAQAQECVFEKLQWPTLMMMNRRRYHCHRNYSKDDTINTERRRGDEWEDLAVNGHKTKIVDDFEYMDKNMLSYLELAREAAFVSQMYADVVSSCYNHDRKSEQETVGTKESGTENIDLTSGILPDVWVSMCRVKDRHYAALAYRWAACVLLPRRRWCRCHCSDNDDKHSPNDDADQFFNELLAISERLGLMDDEEEDEAHHNQTTSMIQSCYRRQERFGKLLLEASAAAHDRAARALRLCPQLRRRTEIGSNGAALGGSGLLSTVLDRERRRTMELLLLHRRFKDNDDNCQSSVKGVTSPTLMTGVRDEDDAVDFHCCYCDPDRDDDVKVAVKTSDYCGTSGNEQEEFATAAVAGGLDVDHGVLIQPRTSFQLAAIPPDFTDTGDDGNNDNRLLSRDSGSGDDDELDEERRVDLFASLGPVAVFSARHRCTAPEWVTVFHPTTQQLTKRGKEDNKLSSADTIGDSLKSIFNRYGFMLRDGNAPPAVVSHVRPNSSAFHSGLRRGNIVVALKLSTAVAGSKILDVRWNASARVAELICQQLQRFPSGSLHLKVVMPLATAAQLKEDLFSNSEKDSPYYPYHDGSYYSVVEANTPKKAITVVDSAEKIMFQRQTKKSAGEISSSAVQIMAQGYPRQSQQHHRHQQHHHRSGRQLVNLSRGYYHNNHHNNRNSHNNIDHNSSTSGSHWSWWNPFRRHHSTDI